MIWVAGLPLSAGWATSRKDLDIVYCVVSRNEMKQMKDIINQIDPFAFITISEAHEILGEGFTLDKEKQPINR